MQKKERIRNELLGIDIEPSLYTSLKNIFDADVNNFLSDRKFTYFK